MRQDVSHKRIAVLGATGRTGRLIVGVARSRGHEVIAVVRRAGSFDDAAAVERVWTDARDPAALGLAIKGADVVISALGGASKGQTSVCADGTRSAIAAMGTAGISRFIVISAHGAGESRDHSLYSLAVWAAVAKRMRDKEAMESLITASSLDWTIVRPPALSDKPATVGYSAGVSVPIRIWSSIGRADLADFLVAEAESSAYVHGFPRVTR